MNKFSSASDIFKSAKSHKDFIIEISALIILLCTILTSLILSVIYFSNPKKIIIIAIILFLVISLAAVIMIIYLIIIHGDYISEIDKENYNIVESNKKLYDRLKSKYKTCRDYYN